VSEPERAEGCVGTQAQVTLALIESQIAQLNELDRERVRQIADALRNAVKAAGRLGAGALTLVLAEMAVEAERPRLMLP
jgi:hypothetical protein